MKLSNKKFKSSKAKKNSKKFLRAIKLIIHCYRWCKWANNFYQKNINKFLTFVHFCEPGDFSESIDRWEHADGDAKTRAEMMDFKNIFNRKIIKKHDYDLIKKTLSNRNRTTEDFNVLRSTLKNMSHMKYLNQLIPEMQENFLKKCWIEEYQEKRVIVAQYQMPRFFYFILNGQLVCTYRNDNENKSSTICILEKGMTFGDLAISSNSMHTSSVVSITNVQLLVIEARDFVDIFLDSRSVISSSNRINNIRENIEYLRGINYFQNWPLQLFETKFEALKLCSYKRNQIIAKDTSFSKYIYVIKKGDCSIWIKLNLDQFAIQGSLDFDFPVSETLGDLNGCFTGKNKILENHHNEVLNSKQIFTVESNMLLKFQNKFKKRKARKNTINEIEAKMLLHEKLEFIDTLKKRDSQTDLDNFEINTRRLRDHLKSIKRAPNGTIYYYQNEYETKQVGPPHTILPPILPNNRQLKVAQHQSINISLPRITKSTLNDTLDLDHKHTESVKYLHLQTLHHGDYYGLNDILFDNQPSMQIISNGCECLLISKEYFIQNSSYDYLKDLKKQVVSYPSLQEIRTQYIKHMKWKNSSKNILYDSLNIKLKRHF